MHPLKPEADSAMESRHQTADTRTGKPRAYLDFHLRASRETIHGLAWDWDVVDDWCAVGKLGTRRSGDDAGRPVAVHVLGLDIIDIMHRLTNQVMRQVM